MLIDSSKDSLKRVIFHSGDKFSSVLAYASKVNEAYANRDILLFKLKCDI